MNYLLSVFLLVITAFSADEKITVYLIGDSTMSEKETKAFPETGWGMPFKYFFDARVKVDNRAKNGRSTRSFLAEGLWEPVKGQLKKGDYVFIQFGHNDESKEKVERYTSPEDFRVNLLKFVADTKEKNATPIMLSPVSRRKFVEGKAAETHSVYSTICKQVAVETGITFIDLDAKSRELYQQFGEENSKLLFLQLSPGEHPNYPEGKVDNTHFNELGARKIAQIVLDEIQHAKVELVNYIVKPQTKK